MVDHAREEKFIYAEHQVLLVHDTDPNQLLEKIENFKQPDGLKRWISREENKSR